MSQLRQTFEEILKLSPTSRDEEFKGHPLHKLIEVDAKLEIVSTIGDPGYSVRGSNGAGRWSETGWVAVFDRLVTETAQRGQYIVYLFRSDGSAMYLSLGQGTTAVQQEVGGALYKEVLAERAAMFAGLLKSEGLDGLHLGPTDLGGTTPLSRGYEAANVAAIRYDAGELPDEVRLRADLLRFLALYRRLVEVTDLLAEEEVAETKKAPEKNPEAQLEAKRLRWHRRADRNQKLAKDAKKIHGTTCAVCGFNYEEKYGSIGEGYIEAHHLTPFAELDDRPTKLNPDTDFAVLCANCHRMVHKKTPPYTLAELTLKQACTLWQSGRDTGSSAIRAGARELTGLPHYFQATYLNDHLKKALSSSEVMDAARTLMNAVAESDPERATASEWREAHQLTPGTFAGRGIEKKDAEKEDEQIRAKLETGKFSMPLWGVSLDEKTAREFGNGNLGFVFQIEGPFRGVAAWDQSGIKENEYEIITGGHYAVLNVSEESNATVVTLRETSDPIPVPQA